MSGLVQLLRQLSAYGNSDTSLGDEAADEIERLTAELASARRDAARYRLLRSRVYIDSEQLILRIYGLILSDNPPDALDAAIDAAIGEKA